MQFVPDTMTELGGELVFPPLEYCPRNELLFSYVQQRTRTIGLEMKSGVSGGGSYGNTAEQFALLIGVKGEGMLSDHEATTVSSLVRRAPVLSLLLNAWHERAEQVGAKG